MFSLEDEQTRLFSSTKRNPTRRFNMLTFLVCTPGVINTANILPGVINTANILLVIHKSSPRILGPSINILAWLNVLFFLLVSSTIPSSPTVIKENQCFRYGVPVLTPCNKNTATIPMLIELCMEHGSPSSWRKHCRRVINCLKSTRFGIFLNTLMISSSTLWRRHFPQNSGFPDECDTDENIHQYIADYVTKEGIRLDPNQIIKNHGLRALGWLMLNSFWGKYIIFVILKIH